mmetsp:Transcript_7646/g.7744  ORF Transcript_7646/g.7744 Transcript_7646/m.7744 type:complete len:102 (+) Transcript_7646:1169-1474(+)
MSIVLAVNSIDDNESTGVWINNAIGVVIDVMTDGVCANAYMGDVSSDGINIVDTSVDTAVNKGVIAKGSVDIVAMLVVTAGTSILTIEFCRTDIIVLMSNV